MSVNDYNRGTESQARAHYVFMRKQGEATEELGKRIVKKIDQLGNVVDVLIDELNQQEMERIFGISTSLDIGNLDKSDQIKLLSYLKTLSVRYGQTSQTQLDYFFAVKKYLNVGNVSDSMNFDAIAELDVSRTELKTFLECVCEFLFLKKGSRSFMTEFKDELDYFGLNDKIIEEIVSSIEKTYEFFGIQGVIEHYSLEPIKRNEEKNDNPIVIPFFEKPIVIIYSSRSKHGEERAKMLQICIHEHLEKINIGCSIESYPGDEAKRKKNVFERDNFNIIYIGEPSLSKPLYKTIHKWDFDKLGMKYITRGRESIITVEELEKEQYNVLLEFAKNQQLYPKNDININLQNTRHSKTKLKNIQYRIAIDKFISSKIDPYIEDRK